MSLLKVARLGHPILRQGCREVPPEELAAPETQRLIDDMRATMVEERGVGIAACQVHSTLRILVVAALHDPFTPDKSPTPEIVLVNPVVAEHGEDRAEDWEGCLSIPDLRGLTPRWREIRVRGLNREGRKVEIDTSDFLARVFQHEIDHLDGKVYLDRMSSLSSLSYTRELEAYHLRRPASQAKD